MIIRLFTLSLLALTVLCVLGPAAAAPVEVTFRFNDAEHKELREALDVFQKQKSTPTRPSRSSST